MIELPKQERGFICTKCGSHECKPGTLNDKHPPCAKCDYLGFAQDTGYTADQLRTYGDQRAAEAREQMREECVKELQGMTTNNATARSAIKQCAEALKELK